jgi:hypothetical protein
MLNAARRGLFGSWVLVVVHVSLLMPPTTRAADARSAAILNQAIRAQGGEQILRSIRTVRLEAFGYRNELEESERPEGPYITEFDTLTEVHDFAGNRYRSITDGVVYPVFKLSSGSVANGNVVMRVAGDTQRAGSPQDLETIREAMALSPERLLITAIDAPDTHIEPDSVLQDVPQNVVAFSLDNAPVRIYLNAFTHLPTAIDYAGSIARTGYWKFLGDVTMRTYYSFWWLAKGGVHLPMQWNIERNGLPDQMYVVRKLQIDEPLNDQELTIPDRVRAQFQKAAPPSGLEDLPLGSPDKPAQELAPGIVFISGFWNTTLVRQDDGIIILEAPISSGYTARVISEARHRFPGQPIKAVITTSDSWPHVAGIRECVAESIPIYALDLNRRILERFIETPHASKPDALQRNPRRPMFHLVSSKTVLGSGLNQIEIYPIRGETSERQMMVFFPRHHLLYGSDPFQANEDGTFFYPQTVSELTSAVEREHLEVKEFFMMHMGPTPWRELGEAVESAKAQDTPTGIL